MDNRTSSSNLASYGDYVVAILPVNGTFEIKNDRASMLKLSGVENVQSVIDGYVEDSYYTPLSITVAITTALEPAIYIGVPSGLDLGVYRLMLLLSGDIPIDSGTTITVN